MGKGGIIGKLNLPTSTIAKGVWKLSDQFLGKKDITWPRGAVAIPTSNLVMHYDAGYYASYPQSGSTWSDLSGSTNTGNLVNSPTFQTDGSLAFVGTSSQMVTTTNSFNNPQAFSIFVIFKTSTASGRKMIGFESNQTGTASGSYDRQLYVASTGVVRFGIFTGSAVTAVSSDTVTDNVWRLAVGTYGSEGTTMRLYFNDTSVATNTASSAQNYTGYWRVAGYKCNSWTGGGDGYFTGDIAVAGVYTRGISGSEVTEIYNAYKPYYQGL